MRRLFRLNLVCGKKKKKKSELTWKTLKSFLWDFGKKMQFVVIMKIIAWKTSSIHSTN